MKKRTSGGVSTPILPRGAMRLRHAPLLVDATSTAHARWSVALEHEDKRRQLMSADDRAVLVDSTGVSILDDSATNAVPSWRRIELSKGRPASAVSGPFVWVCDDGRVRRWTVDGAIEDLAVRAKSAIGLDARRLLIAPDDASGELALIGDGAELWRAKATLGDSCPISDETFLAGIPGDANRLTLLDLASGRARWKSRLGPHIIGAVLAAHAGAVWIASTECEVFSLALDSGRVAHAHDTGVRAPTGGIDCHGALQICHERRWVTVQLSADADVRERLAVTNGPYVDPPVPTLSGGLLVRSGKGGLYLLTDAGASEILPSGKLVHGIASSGRSLFVLEGTGVGVLHKFEFTN